MKYTREQRRRAVELYVRYECCAADVIRELGYPSREALRMWHRDWLEEQETGVPSRRGERYARYTLEQRRAAVDHYLTHGRRASRTIRQLGYPSKEVLASWIDELAPGERRVRRGPVPEESKREAVLRVASGEMTSREAAEGLGVDSSVVRNWKRRLLDGTKGVLTVKDDRDGAGHAAPTDPEALRGEIDELRAGLERLRAEYRDAEIRLAIMRKSAELVGKEPGADPDNLTNREKATLIKAVSEECGIRAEELLARVGIARSTYYYQLKAMNRPDKDQGLLALVREAFENSRRRYGYKRIHQELRSAGIVVSAKRVMRLMTRHGMVPVFKSAKRYSSYKGEIGRAPGNLVNRDFHAANPNELWVTDITEFSIPAGKVYLSPVIDCYDGMPVAWTIGTSPNAALANGMLEDACATLRPGQTPVIHSDRGCHYRWPEWIRICKDHGLTRSMSAKGCSPDNAAAEGFFGRLKQEFFHKRSFQGVTIDDFIGMLDEYMVWYRDKRIKLEYGMSIMDKRIELGLVA
ncbi:integrase [Bifidobacterium margollesii]|uniref:Integrase n=1 Tax=Bifidobacterium margollesii TaxID=2020964 RepID=A0A2N5JA68_9BIFI|nr:integrase [Bifidobacterium margollesii]